MTVKKVKATPAKADPDLRAQGVAAMRAALPGVFPEGDINLRDDKVAGELLDIGLLSVWGALWAREGLSPRDRSLVTLALLLAQHAEAEFRTHVRIGIGNGLTETEISELIYHAAGYVGFPAAVVARNAARAALAGAGPT